MNPEKGAVVRVYFKSGLFEDGTVESWSDNKTVLKSPSGTSLIIIQNTLQDVLLVKVDVGESKPIIEVPIDDELKLEEPEPNQNLRVMKLAELRKQKGIEERKLAREQLTTFRSTNCGGSYGLPKLGQRFSNSPQKKTG
jgi:hypothetical protein